MSTFASLALSYTKSIPGPDRETRNRIKVLHATRARTYVPREREAYRGAARAHVQLAHLEPPFLKS